MTDSTTPWMIDRMQPSLVGAAGEHYCMTQLLLRGFTAALTPRGAEDADILVRSADGALMAEIQVKARSGRSGRGWRMSQRHERLVRDRLFYCFVDFGHQTDWPVYVMRSEEVARYLKNSHEGWLTTPGKGGAKHKDWSGRFMSPRPAPGFSEGWMDNYRGHWELITDSAASG